MKKADIQDFMNLLENFYLEGNFRVTWSSPEKRRDSAQAIEEFLDEWLKEHINYQFAVAERSDEVDSLSESNKEKLLKLYELGEITLQHVTQWPDGDPRKKPTIDRLIQGLLTIHQHLVEQVKVNPHEIGYKLTDIEAARKIIRQALVSRVASMTPVGVPHDSSASVPEAPQSPAASGTSSTRLKTLRTLVRTLGVLAAVAGVLAGHSRGCCSSTAYTFNSISWRGSRRGISSKRDICCCSL